MADFSNYDEKYFCSHDTYNCPYCNRRNVIFSVNSSFKFDWSEEKEAYGIIVRCSQCGGRSLHLTFNKDLAVYTNRYEINEKIEDIDNEIFYSHPTSFFTLDNRIPRTIRDLVAEADNSRKMNLLTGASACLRKAIYELLRREGVEGTNYDEKIKNLKSKFPYVDTSYFDILGHIKDMTSDKVHEFSWEKWDAKHITLFTETLKNILNEVYVLPEMRKEQSSKIALLMENVFGKK